MWKKIHFPIVSSSRRKCNGISAEQATDCPCLFSLARILNFLWSKLCWIYNAMLLIKMRIFCLPEKKVKKNDITNRKFAMLFRLTAMCHQYNLNCRRIYEFNSSLFFYFSAYPKINSQYAFRSMSREKWP